MPVEGAAVPILTFDWEGINIDLLFARLNSNSAPKDMDINNDATLDGVDSATEKSLNGPRVTNLIEAFVRGTPQRYQTFLAVVRCVRKWAKARGLYSNKMGYWGGVNINIAVAQCLQLYPNACPATLLRRYVFCESPFSDEFAERLMIYAKTSGSFSYSKLGVGHNLSCLPNRTTQGLVWLCGVPPQPLDKLLP